MTGEELRTILKAEPFMQKALAELIEVSPETVSRWCSGVYRVPAGVSLLARIAARIPFAEMQAIKRHWP